MKALPLLLLPLISAARLTREVSLSPTAGAWTYSGKWTCGELRHGTGRVVLDTYASAVEVSAAGAVLHAPGAEVDGLKARYPAFGPVHLELERTDKEIVLAQAVVTVEIETNATDIEDVPVDEVRFTGPSHRIPPGYSFVQLTGMRGPAFSDLTITITGNGTARTARVRQEQCEAYDILWMGPLDPAVEYTLAVEGKGDLGLEKMFLHAAGWNKPCSASVKPWNCRWTRARRWADGHWLIGAIALFLFFLLKGLLWLALGSGLFVSMRELWRRFRLTTEEREPLLGEDSEAASEDPPRGEGLV